MKINITLAGNSFSAEGEATDNDTTLSMLRTWVNAQQIGNDAVAIEILTDKMRHNNNTLAAVVALFTPAVVPEGP